MVTPSSALTAALTNEISRSVKATIRPRNPHVNKNLHRVGGSVRDLVAFLRADHPQVHIYVMSMVRLGITNLRITQCRIYSETGCPMVTSVRSGRLKGQSENV